MTAKIIVNGQRFVPTIRCDLITDSGESKAELTGAQLRHL